MIDLANLPIDITTHILNFRDFLNKADPCLTVMMENHSWEEDAIFWDDWMQMNWELLVERKLLGKDKYLFPISWTCFSFREKQAQFKVVCETTAELRLRGQKRNSKYNGEELLIFGFFTFRKDGCIITGFPLDYVQLCIYPKKTLYLVPVDSCRFILKEIGGDPTI